MARENIPFDPNHPRCKFPEFGRAFDAIMTRRNLRAPTIAKAIDVSPEIIRAYRRGFNKPSAETLAKLERFLDTKVLDDTAPQDVSVRGTIVAKRDGDHVVLTMRVPLSDFRGLIEAE